MKKKMVYLLCSIIIYIIISFSRAYSFSLSLALGCFFYASISIFAFIKSKEDFKESIKIAIIILSVHLMFLLICFIFFYDRFFLKSLLPTIFYIVIPLIIACIFSFIKERKYSFLVLSLYVFFSVFFIVKINPFWADYISNYVSVKSLKGEKSVLHNDYYEVFNSNLESKNLFLDDNKMVVIDVWTKYCSACFRNLHKFQDIRKEFSSNSNISFFTLGIPLKGDSIDDLSRKMTNFNSSFDQLFAQNEAFFKDFGFNSVPHLMLFKGNRLIYEGSSFYWLSKAISKFEN
ncbi:TlpA family protein disulfide reductase [Bizionia sp. KMM 8389]